MLQVTTIHSAFAASSTVSIYALPPAQMPKARLIKANAYVQGAAPAAGASDSITIKALNSGGSSYATTVATGAVSAVGSHQAIQLAVTKASAAAAASIITQTRPALITIPDCGNITPAVDIVLTWDGTAPTTLAAGV